jgi:2-keto-3-deoxygluconate permease
MKKKHNVDVYALYRKVPGGMLLVPMFLIAVINTLFPDLIGSFGGMTTALFKTGTLAFGAIILFAVGADIKLATLGTVLKRSSALAIAKLALSFASGILFIKFFGMEGVWGINAVAFVTCMCSCNPGVYMGLVQDYGEEEDMGNFAAVNILSMPCFPLLILAAASGSQFNPMDIITVFIPFLLGLVVGNLDPKLAKVYSATTPIALPFMGCCFGASINLITALQAGLAGILLTVIYLVLHMVVMLPVDKFVNRRPGYAAMAMCSVAGLALTVPELMGDGEYADIANDAIPQIAACLILTSIASSLLTKIVAKMGKNGATVS